MIKLCNWCQTEVSLIHESWDDYNVEYRDLCTDCLIEILPKTLSKEDPKSQTEMEHRAARRYPVATQVYLQSQKERKIVTQVVIQNISDTGMKLILKDELLPGEKVIIGVIGTKIVYKAIMNVVYLKPMNQTETTCFEAGMRLIGIHQELK